MSPPPASPLAADEAPPASPWDNLDPAGDGLTVDNFLTARIGQTINLLRRVVTLPYAQQAGLSVSEWRLLSYVAFARKIPFADLVVLSTSDKALVSRTIRLLEQRGLIRTEHFGSTPRKKVTVLITPEGAALHDKVIPIARASQAEMINLLTLTERRAMYSGLKKLMDHCESKRPARDESESESEPDPEPDPAGND